MDVISNWLANTPDFAVPYALAALGLILTERSGVLSLGAEGMMLIGALVGVGAQIAWGVSGVSLLLAMLAAGAVSLLFAMMVILLRVNQVIAGLALVFFCQGLSSLAGTLLDWTNQAITGIGPLPLGPLASLPLVGHMLFDQNIVVYLTAPIFLLVWLFLNRTMTGLKLRAVVRIRRPPTPPGFRWAGTGCSRWWPAPRWWAWPALICQWSAPSCGSRA